MAYEDNKSSNLGKVTFKGVAEAFNFDYMPPEKAILE